MVLGREGGDFLSIVLCFFVGRLSFLPFQLESVSSTSRKPGVDLSRLRDAFTSKTHSAQSMPEDSFVTTHGNEVVDFRSVGWGWPRKLWL